MNVNSGVKSIPAADSKFEAFFGPHDQVPDARHAPTQIEGDRILTGASVIRHPQADKDYSALGTLVGDDHVGWAYVDLTPVPFRIRALDADGSMVETVHRAKIPTLHIVARGMLRRNDIMLDKLQESRAALKYDLEHAKTRAEKVKVLHKYAATEKNMAKAWREVKELKDKDHKYIIKRAKVTDDKSFLARYRARNGQTHTPEQILQYAKGYNSALSANKAWRKWGRVIDRPVIMARAMRDMWSSPYRIGGEGSRNGWITLPITLTVGAAVSLITIYLIHQASLKKQAEPMYVTT